MNPQYAAVAARAAHRCEYCRAPEVLSTSPFEVEHIVPSSRGGGDEDSNLALACRSCNVYKASALDYIDPQSNTTQPLFNPRADHWSAHFQVEPETNEVIGATAIGRATIACLRMNRPRQKNARELWTRLGLFP